MTLPEIREQAKAIAKQIVSGETDPYNGAVKIWKTLLDKYDGRIPDDLWPFKSNASAIEDCLWDARDSGSNHDTLIARCRDEIIQAARDILD